MVEIKRKASNKKPEKSEEISAVAALLEAALKGNSEKGDPGKDGRDGRNGKDGINGKDGKDGKDGRRGRDGMAGLNGIDGKNGKDGLNGKDGAPGKNGKDGAPGKDGKDGKDGKRGPVGITGKVGPAGRGIESITQPRQGVARINYTDGTHDTIVLPRGEDGREIELGASATHIQWRYVGESQWHDLIPISLIKNALQASGGAGPIVLKLNTLSDVNIENVTNGQVLQYNAATKKWINSNASGGGGTWGSITGTLSSQTDLQNALNAKLDASVIDTDPTLSADSDLLIASQKAVKSYADQLIAAANGVIFKGAIDASTNPNYPAADAGWLYRISVAGKIGGASGINVEIGDIILCLVDGSAAGNQATVGANWNISQANIDGAVIGPTSAVNNALALFDGTTGKLIKNSSTIIDTDTALTANSDTRIATQRAIKAYADTKQAAGNYITALTGDGTASGPGSSAFTLATVNSNIGNFRQITVNAKGLITSATNNVTISTQSGTTYTLQASDNGTFIRFTSSTDVTVTCPNSFAAGYNVGILQIGTGKVIFSAASGAVILNSRGYTKTYGQGSAASLIVDNNSGGTSANYISGGDMA